MSGIKHRDNKYIKFLDNVSRDVIPVSNAQVAALLVFKNYPIAIGTNRMKSHPFQLRFSKNCEAIFLHAEIDVILRALKNNTREEIKKSTLYICRTTKNGRRAIAKPCAGCEKAIKEYGISRIVYTNSADEIIEINHEV